MMFVHPHPHLGTFFGKVGFRVTSEYNFKDQLRPGLELGTSQTTAQRPTTKLRRPVFVFVFVVVVVVVAAVVMSA